jgi:flagellar motor switch protein FliN/FliY
LITDFLVNAPFKAADMTGQVQLIELDEMTEGADAPSARVVEDFNPLHQVKTTLQANVGSLSISIGELMTLKEHQVLRLEQKVDDAIELLIEGKTVARGQLVAVDGQFAIRITELPVALQI